MAFGKTVKDPFITPVGQLIAISTIGTQKSEDWGQFMNICDVINSTVDGPKDAVKALKRKISKNYNQKEVGLSLSLLDMCMQNCNSTFQSLVLKKEFCKDVLVKLLNPKYNLPVNLQNRILRLIMTWATSLQGNVDLAEVKELYLELIKKGIQFPSLDANGETTIETQKINEQVNLSDSCTSSSCLETGQHLSPEQIGKLYSELDMVKMNVKVMSEILLENPPGAEIPQDMELLQELQKACQEMQVRILKLLEIVQNEDVIIELVQVNDDLNNIFLRHKRYSRTRGNQAEETIRQQDSQATFINEPSAPSSEIIEINLAPLPSTQNQTNGYPMPAVLSEITPQRAHNSDIANAQLPQEICSNSMYPQLDLLELREAVNTPFAFGVQSQLPKLPPRSLYDNILHDTSFLPLAQNGTPLFQGVPMSSPFLPTIQHSTPVLPPPPNSSPLLPVNSNLLPAIPILSPTIVPTSKDSTRTLAEKSDDSNISAPLPNYYELLEFDPLTKGNGTEGTEAIYEEIDMTPWKQKKGTEC
ncbi:TOM1-like protein 1 [Pseudophryne corroboree]|uniref:TOM1-like protein 1 n=1 Tax=Pseudophryne corroboree TaxID=495146 RepID=UPI0030820D14